MNIVIVAGEVSGDLLGGKLVNALTNIDQNIKISGIGGQTMRDAGADTLFDVSETSVVGIVEILQHYPRLRKILSTLKRHINEQRPDLLILIDYPEFNLKLARYAKSLGIKVMFYVSPQVWAWRTKRVKKIKKCIDLMAVLFPFELEFYEKENVPACLVRHPLLDDIDRFYTPQTNSNKQTIKFGLLPGSRHNEIKKLLPEMIAAGKQLLDENENIEFIMPVAHGISIDQLKQYNIYDLPISYYEENFYQSIRQCKAVVIASGTATLQTALMAVPMVIIYKISPLTYKLFGHLVKVPHIGLANIILKRREFTELIQDEASPQNIFKALQALLEEENLQQRMVNNREEIYKKLSSGINSTQLAEQAIALTKIN